MIQAKEWSEKTGRIFKICVNTSLLQYTDNGRHSAGWLEILKPQQSLANHIVLEVSEKLLVDPQNSVIEKINQLRDYGIEISIDDFGTGYSSMANIKQFNINYLKINKKFIQSLSEGNDGKVLCEAIIAMATKLGTRVVAEGIEEPEQLTLLRAMGCELGQGFHLANPMMANQFSQQLLKR
jgi:EAL domain-containing protein (putative c-di-GMP-specific phosphodiesterase class I)